MRKIEERWRHGLRWWHWLSGDAVFVVMAYSWAASRWSQASAPPGVHWLLGVGIWLGYVADRWEDARREPARALASPRHDFHRRHGRVLRGIWWVVCLGLVAIGGWWLPRAAFWGGAAIALLAWVYVRRFSVRGAGSVPSVAVKRLTTVFLLSLAGVWWWPWWGVNDPPKGLVVVLLFALAAGWELLLLHHREWISSRPRLRFAGRWILPTVLTALALVGLGRGALPGVWVIAGGLVMVQEAGVPGDVCVRAALADGGLAAGFFLLGVLGR